MADCYRYMPQTTVEWTSSQAYWQFRLWQTEAERITNSPMHRDADSVKLNTVYIWLVLMTCRNSCGSQKSEDLALTIETVNQLLDCISQCLTHSMFFEKQGKISIISNKNQVRMRPLSTVESWNSWLLISWFWFMVAWTLSASENWWQKAKTLRLNSAWTYCDSMKPLM